MHSFKSSVNNSYRYSAKRMAKPINFRCLETQAESVAIMGDFNDWNPESHPMQRQPDGSWQTQIPLHHGHHHYLFVVDGEPELDPNASGVGRNENNKRVSLLAVS